MNSIKSEWPLLVFTTVAPLCAGSWIVLAVLALADADPRAISLTMGVSGVALCVALGISLACSTLHLGKPVKALRAFRRLGNSTVSNEVFMGTLFMAFSLIYLVVAHSMGALADLRKVLLALVAAFAALFVVFQCLAYRMRTVPTWNSFSFAIEFAIMAVFGGSVLVGIMGVAGVPLVFEVRLILVAVAFLGCFFMVVVAGAQRSAVLRLAWHGSRALREPAFGVLDAIRLAALVFGTVIWGHAMLTPNPSLALAAAGGAVVLVGIVCGRYTFYRSYCNVGLPRE